MIIVVNLTTSNKTRVLPSQGVVVQVSSSVMQAEYVDDFVFLNSLGVAAEL